MAFPKLPQTKDIAAVVLPVWDITEEYGESRLNRDPDTLRWRLYKKNGVLTPTWMTPATNCKVIAHDIIHHFRYSIPELNIDSDLESRLLEIEAIGATLCSSLSLFPQSNDVRFSCESVLELLEQYGSVEDDFNKLIPYRNIDFLDYLTSFSSDYFECNVTKMNLYRLARHFSIGFNWAIRHKHLGNPLYEIRQYFDRARYNIEDFMYESKIPGFKINYEYSSGNVDIKMFHVNLQDILEYDETCLY